MHIIFDPSVGGFNFGEYSQSGEGIGYYKGLPPYQRGYGRYVGMPPYQRGAGLGDIFRKFWRVLQPIAKSLGPVVSSAGKAIGQEGLATTARVLSDVVQGTELKDAIEREGRQGARNLLSRAQRKLTTDGQSGRGRHRSYKRKAKFKKKVILKPDNKFVGRIVRGIKKPRFDNLGSI
jgi:hypothetical protein